MNIQQHRPRNLEIKRDPMSLIFNLFYTRGHLVKRLTFHNKVNSWNNLAGPLVILRCVLFYFGRFV